MLRTELVLAIVSLALAGASGSHVILNGTSIGSAESPSQDQGVDIPDLWDSNSWSFFLLLQLFPAQLSDIFPGSPWVFLSPDTSFYRLKVCERAAVTDCMPAGSGNDSAGIPENVQGIWWTEGAKTRTAVISTYTDGQWGYEASSSRWQGFAWTASGAAFFNFLLTVQEETHLRFNEDVTHAQVIPTFYVLGIPFELPTFLAEMTMSWEGQDTWKRHTTLYTLFKSEAGTYNLRRIINGDGSKGLWFDKGWLTYKNGIPVAVPEQAF